MRLKLLTLFFLQIFCVLSLLAQNDSEKLQSIDSGSTTENSEIFKEYPWLLDKIDLENCETYSVSVAQKSNGAKPFIYLNDGKLSIMFTAEGKQYCKDTDDFSCEEYYKLDKVIKTWQCLKD